MSAGTRTPYTEALTTAEHVVDVLAAYCDRIEIAGSLRRKRPFVGDIEIVALPTRQVNLLGDPIPGRTPLDAFLEASGVMFIKNGQRYKQFAYGRYKIDLFLPASADHWGSVFFIRTGSHDFNMWVMNTRAAQAGVMFRGGLLYRRYNDELVPTPEEADVFAALGLPVVPPEDRDDGRWLRYVA